MNSADIPFDYSPIELYILAKMSHMIPPFPTCPHLIKFYMGDRCDDGYGRFESVTVYSNRTPAEIEAAYTRGVEIIGHDLVKQYAAEYNDCTLPQEAWAAYRARGYDFGGDEEMARADAQVAKDGHFYLDPEFYFDLYLLTIEAGDPDFELRTIQPAPSEQMDIGGYGLFGN